VIAALPCGGIAALPCGGIAALPCGGIAALPMYDWPERRDEVDAEWGVVRDRLRARGIVAPDTLTRRNADLPAVPGGIRDAQGVLLAPDPAALPPDEFDLPTLWRHPNLLYAQTCWGPLELGLAPYVSVIGQMDYGEWEGCDGPLYSSAIVMRRGESGMTGKRLAFSSRDSMSGYLVLERALGTLDGFSALVETGEHRASIRAIAAGHADVATIDARTWQLAKLYEPAAKALDVVGWTAKRLGLPFITARRSGLSPDLFA